MDMRLIVDGNTVMGSKPDVWWRDRAGAAARLVQAIAAWARATGREGVVVVFDGRRPSGFRDPPAIEVRFAERPGRDAADDAIAALVAGASSPAQLEVVTSDSELARRVREHGTAVTPAGAFRRAVEERR